MKWIPLIITMITLTFQGNPASSASFVPGELLVKYKPGTCPKNLSGELGKIGWAKIKIDKSKPMSQVMIALKENLNVIHVEPNYYGEFLSDPNDPQFDQQWYLPNIEAPGAWDKSLGTDVIIGLVDSGVDLDHEDLADNIWINPDEIPDNGEDDDGNGYIDDVNGWDFGDDDDDPTDEYGHGTMVCGVIAAIQNNEIGISGIAPQSKILPLKVSESGSPIASAVAEAIIYASDHGAKIINLSLGLGEDSQAVTDAINEAVAHGVLLVAAAGLKNRSVYFPASLEEVIAVSATNENNEFYIESAKGPEIELSAPGENIYTTKVGDGYTIRSGTSLSSPIVSAVAALLSAQYPHLTRDQIRESLITRADDLGSEGRDDQYGYGKVNALKTLSLITFVFPATLLGSSNIPLPHLLAVIGEGTHFTLVNSKVSFESAHIMPLGPPLVLFPNLLLQLTILESNPSEGYSNITVTTGTEKFNGYDIITIGLLPWNL
jgi:subtilisin family serine protease